MRHRPSEFARETDRLATSIAGSLGRDVRRGRIGARLTQAELGALVGIHQTWVSDIELGRGDGVPLHLWVALGVAVGRPLAMAFSKPIYSDAMHDRIADAGHLQMQEALLAMAAATGRRATAELPTRPSDPSHSIDVAVWDEQHRTLIVQEAWNTFGDVGAAIRSTHRKAAEAAEAADLAAFATGDQRPYRVATVWIVRASAANRALLARYPNLFAATFDGSSRAWTRALVTGAAPPTRPGIVWFDPTARRINEWRRR
jgi:transcriptional regulator with XRE-family HTH domain